eukprot:CAMPEP_0113961836 /NCGR_PEP_ID=MMETSP0011_2-20120614/5557_1 /TAXON_ID=101924 /ORGANISM="Rhodosorus marinus" /LENGTH=877 /DNA_ID=CAMNT_0000973575 /DNA_START=203 /DNA_END=2836 /DNA_ORIENTATION=+ /assembly_acc=CAM_ASM_000156
MKVLFAFILCCLIVLFRTVLANTCAERLGENETPFIDLDRYMLQDDKGRLRGKVWLRMVQREPSPGNVTNCFRLEFRTFGMFTLKRIRGGIFQRADLIPEGNERFTMVRGFGSPKTRKKLQICLKDIPADGSCCDNIMVMVADANMANRNGKIVRTKIVDTKCSVAVPIPDADFQVCPVRLQCKDQPPPPGQCSTSYAKLNELSAQPVNDKIYVEAVVAPGLRNGSEAESFKLAVYGLNEARDQARFAFSTNSSDVEVETAPGREFSLLAFKDVPLDGNQFQFGYALSVLNALSGVVADFVSLMGSPVALDGPAMGLKAAFLNVSIIAEPVIPETFGRISSTQCGLCKSLNETTRTEWVPMARTELSLNVLQFFKAEEDCLVQPNPIGACGGTSFSRINELGQKRGSFNPFVEVALPPGEDEGQAVSAFSVALYAPVPGSPNSVRFFSGIDNKTIGGTIDSAAPADGVFLSFSPDVMKIQGDVSQVFVGAVALLKFGQVVDFISFGGEKTAVDGPAKDMIGLSVGPPVNTMSVPATRKSVPWGATSRLEKCDACSSLRQSSGEPVGLCRVGATRCGLCSSSSQRTENYFYGPSTELDLNPYQFFENFPDAGNCSVPFNRNVGPCDPTFVKINEVGRLSGNLFLEAVVEPGISDAQAKKEYGVAVYLDVQDQGLRFFSLAFHGLFGLVETAEVETGTFISFTSFLFINSDLLDFINTSKFSMGFVLLRRGIRIDSVILKFPGATPGSFIGGPFEGPGFGSEIDLGAQGLPGEGSSLGRTGSIQCSLCTTQDAEDVWRRNTATKLTINVDQTYTVSTQCLVDEPSYFYMGNQTMYYYGYGAGPIGGNETNDRPPMDYYDYGVESMGGNETNDGPPMYYS